MSQTFPMKVIAHLYGAFSEKFGIPRQSGLVKTDAKIIFEPEYRVMESLRGLEEFSHLWLLWQFSQAIRSEWSPTVRPPKLGGNARVGVFASRSPFRPNPIGLSSVELVFIEWQTPNGPVLHIRGADLLDGTPIFDIKPYLSYTDSHPEATHGFACTANDGLLQVNIPDTFLQKIPPEHREALFALLAQDPRPGYQHEPDRIYHFAYANKQIHFCVQENRLTVIDVTEK